MNFQSIPGSIFSAGLALLGRRRQPKKNGQLRIDGITDRIEIFTDRWGVPHIYAQNMPDLFFAQGYIHASERLWQMEFNRRLVAGRLSEVLGAETVSLDRWMRTIGMRRTAELEPILYDAESTSLMNSYCRGVNAWISAGRLPVEFSLLRYQPEPWTMVDSLSWVKMMSYMLSVNWESELLRACLIDRLGPEKEAELEPPPDEQAHCVFPLDPDFFRIKDSALERASQARHYTGPSASSGAGSNNWVVSGSRTTTHKPFLANDMHLGMSIPAIWFENHLSSPQLNVTGVTFPGIPGVVAGHNDRFAWGFTDGFPDVQDLYMEHLRRTEDGSVEAEYCGKWEPATVWKEVIRVKGGEPVVEEVVSTRHGPIINCLAPDLTGETQLALRWTSYEPDTMLAATFKIGRAQDYAGFKEALMDWTAPVQNTVYADVDGNIAYDFQGKVPIRAKGDGSVPVPGWTDEYEWTGYIPRDELPHLFNPPQGYIATANARVVGENYPYFVSRDYCHDDRVRRITELLEKREIVDAAYIQEMQFDQVSLTAQRLAQMIADLDDMGDPELGTVIKRMGHWDGYLGSDQPDTVIYQVFFRKLLEIILTPQLGDLALRYMGKGPVPPIVEESLFGQRALDWLIKTLDQRNSSWLQQDGVTRDDLMRRALRETIDYLKAQQGPDLNRWSWGAIHKLTFAHILGRVPALKKFFNRGPISVGGDFNTIWATGTSQFSLSSEMMTAPPYRSIYDLSDLNKSLGLLAPGNSGHPTSRHYDDQLEAWFEKGYHPMLFAREDVERECKEKMVFYN